MKPYNKSNIPLAKNLRKSMTPWERKLWYDYLRYYPVRFQRQKAIGNYIVDFYCAKARLVVELDGGGHYESEQSAADTVRTQHLENMKLTVLRVCNLDVDKNFSGVCEYIDMAVQKALPQSASLTAPSTAGASRGSKVIYALGFFDGVHLGHQALLCACRELARENGCKAGVVTFTSHPDTLVLGQTPGLINTTEDRKRLLLSMGMDCIVELPFDKALMKMSWQDFFRMLTGKHSAAGLVCGHDFRFGYKGEGTAALLQQACKDAKLPCQVVAEQTLEGVTISSTHIRKLLEAGDLAQANRFLGHPHMLSGTVVAGRGVGHTMDIPTANLLLPEEVLVPSHGVYACKALVDGKEYLAVTNIGSRPTVGGHQVRAESWLLDFEGDLYGKPLALQFYHFLRPEQRFDSLEALKTQIQADAAKTRDLLH